MNIKALLVGGLAVLLAVALASPMLAQEEKKAEKAEKAEKSEKAKAQKVSGDIGLLDTEKNYMIVVTKDGKLVTLDLHPENQGNGVKRKSSQNGRHRPWLFGCG